jgi:hypothetical protein
MTTPAVLCVFDLKAVEMRTCHQIKTGAPTISRTIKPTNGAGGIPTSVVGDDHFQIFEFAIGNPGRRARPLIAHAPR